MMKYYKIILALILLIAVSLLAFSSYSLAIWREQAEAERAVTPPITEINASLKHLKFVPLDAQGEKTASEPVSYAVVGSDGLIGEIIIPDTYNGLPVTRIAVDSEYMEARFENNPIITKITVSVNVTYIGRGALMNMTNLKEVRFMSAPYGTTGAYSGAETLVIADYAFQGCTKLTVFDAASKRSVQGDRASYLLGTGLI